MACVSTWLDWLATSRDRSGPRRPPPRSVARARAGPPTTWLTDRAVLRHAATLQVPVFPVPRESKPAARDSIGRMGHIQPNQDWRRGLGSKGLDQQQRGERS